MLWSWPLGSPLKLCAFKLLTSMPSVSSWCPSHHPQTGLGRKPKVLGRSFFIQPTTANPWKHPRHMGYSTCEISYQRTAWLHLVWGDTRRDLNCPKNKVKTKIPVCRRAMDSHLEFPFVPSLFLLLLSPSLSKQHWSLPKPLTYRHSSVQTTFILFFRHTYSS